MQPRIGADVGGTFTDIVLIGADGRTFQFGKVLTTPQQPDAAIISGIRQVLEMATTEPGAVAHVIHGTTLFTNALIERKGPKTALVTTKGFRDAIEIAREHRYDIYDLYIRRAEPLAPRHLRFELDERLLVDGTVRKALDEEDVRRIARALRDEKVGAVAICLIHSYVNDAHERRVEEILRNELPGVSVTRSSDLVPEIREYDRTSTTLANVYVKPIAQAYLRSLRDRLRTEGIVGELFIMQSNGGVCEIGTATKYPIRLVESGPAAGALAATFYGALLGHRDILAFDMGGTTAKACVIHDSNPLITNEFEVDRQYQFKKHSGLPVKVPVIDMIEIGTGGGSIARVDSLKRLRVGPDSAGAEPGPVSYRRGGTEPTVTDADLTLGYLDPAYFLGGTMALDAEGAERAILEKVGRPLELPLTEAAWGIHQLANESMASAARIHAIERGKDVSRFPIFAFGGAGPVHAYGVARILRCPRVIFPFGAGVMSAIGFMVAPISMDFSRSAPGTLEGLNWDSAAMLVEEMERDGRAVLRTSVPADRISFKRFADMRYAGQGYEVRVPIPIRALDAACLTEIKDNFEKVYETIYGHRMAGGTIEIVNWRVIAHGPAPELVLPKARVSPGGRAAEALKGSRLAYLPDDKRLRKMPVYDRYALPARSHLAGPAIVEERESTVVINGPADIRVDEFCNLVVDLPLRDGPVSKGSKELPG